jgi:transposase
MLSDIVDYVIGVDPDRDRITLAVLAASTQAKSAASSFATTARGYRQALRWVGELTEEHPRAWSIEGAGSYGAGPGMTLVGAGELVVEFDHPLTPAAKDRAKSDALDAERAALEVMSRPRWSNPRSRGAREGLRALITARDSAKVSRTAAINVLRALMLTAPVPLREELRTLTFTRLIDRCSHLRPETSTDAEVSATKLALRTTAARVASLSQEMAELEAAMKTLVRQLCPVLLDEPGIGTLLAAQIIVSWSHHGRCHSEAAFARLAGVAPIPATSGQNQTRFRLSRAGDRQLNRAIHQAVVIRAKTHPATRDYLTRRISEGKTKREAMRCAKRYLARHLFRVLEASPSST